jgi:hypothetical protein
MLHNTPMSARLISLVNALDQRNWHAALELGLALPLLCVHLERGACRDQRGRFVAWFDRFVLPHLDEEALPGGRGARALRRFTGEDCFAIRCLVLQDDSARIRGRQVVLRSADGHELAYAITLHHPGPSGPDGLPAVSDTRCEEADGLVTVHIDVYVLCMCIAKGVVAWLERAEDDPDLVQRIADLITIDQPEAAAEHARA